MRKPVVIRICGCLLAFLMVFSVLAVTASAVPKYVSLDGSAVEDDLETLIGKEELDKLILDETVSDDDGGQFLSVIRLLEFGYDARQENWDYYGLYLYIYNPSGKPLVSTTKNCVEMQVGMYNGERTDVVKYPLKLLSFSSDYTLYKYEITGLRMGVLRQMNLSQREYHIAGMELQFSGQSNPKDYDISMSYIFSGFNAGFDSMRSSIDTLRWRYEQLETIAVELHPTSWMSDTSDRGEGYRYEVSGVYFAIPNYYLKTYGNWDGDEELHGLYAVSGSYRESRINGIVTDSEAVYTAAQQVAGKSIKWYGYDQHDTADIRERNGVIYRDDFPLHFYWDLYWNEPGVDDYRVRASYNIPAEIGGFWDQVIVQSDRTLDKICIPFHSASDEAIPADVVSQALAEYSGVDYRNTDVDDGRTYGNQVYTVTADDPPMGFTKYDYSQDHPFLAWLLNGGTKNDKQAEVEWLQRIDLEFLESVGWTDTTTIAEKYYIGEGDVAGLRELCNSSAVQTALTAGIKGATVYMMHFARTDYFSTSVQCFASGDITETEYPGNHYYYERTVFEDFDILQFTFKRENGELTKIPVVASPVNITGGLPAPSDPDGNPSNPGTEDPGPGELIAGCAETFGGLNGWGKLVVLLLGVVLIALLFGPLAKLLSPLFGLIGKAIGGLFKGIGSLFRGGANAVSTAFSAKEKTYDAKRKRTEDEQADADRERRLAEEDARKENSRTEKRGENGSDRSGPEK